MPPACLKWRWPRLGGACSVTLPFLCTYSQAADFDLEGVAVHRGTVLRGHYYYLKRDFVRGTWVKCDDLCITDVSLPSYEFLLHATTRRYVLSSYSSCFPRLGKGDCWRCRGNIWWANTKWWCSRHGVLPGVPSKDNHAVGTKSPGT